MAKRSTNNAQHEGCISDVLALCSVPRSWIGSSTWDACCNGIDFDNVDVKQKVLSIDNALRRGILESPTLLDVPETTGEGCVQIHLQKYVNDVLANLKFTNVSLSKFSANVGRVSNLSFPDGMWTVEINGKTHIVGILEWKGTYDSLNGPLRQAIGEAVNVAFALFAGGVETKDVLVPIVVCNGRLMQFGFVKLLEPCYPSFVATSYVLDLQSEVGRQEAAQRLFTCDYVCQSYRRYTVQERKDDVIQNLTDTLNASLYFKKPFSEFSTLDMELEVRLSKMVDILALVHNSNSEAKNHIVFPLGVANSQDDGFLLFDNLHPTFRIGLPTDKATRLAIAAELRRVIKLVHEAGAVHMDLYLSNVMWKKHHDRMEIKIIDWDVVHEIGDPLSDVTMLRLKRSGRRERYPEINVATGELDTFFVDVLDASIDNEDLQTIEKDKLDTAFFEACIKFVNE